MTHIGLFEGIGGFSLAARWMGWETVGWCEINPFGQQVLKYYYPEAEAFTDIKQSDFTKYANRIDVLTGGFPCQPYSQAGKRLGKDDERHLWPEMLRAIREIQPRWVVGENVRGLTNWNGGMVFDEVQADLELAGYEVLPFLLPACAKDAPHRRDRIWFIAYSGSNGHQSRGFGENRYKEAEGKIIKDKWERIWDDSLGTSQQGVITNTESLRERSGTEEQRSNERGREQLEGSKQGRYGDNNGIGWDATNTNRQGFKKRVQPGEREISGTYAAPTRGKSSRAYTEGNWSEFPTQSPLCSRNDGLSTELSGITFSKHRNESIKAYGNAIVPQVAFEIFKAIEAYQTLKTEAI